MGKSQSARRLQVLVAAAGAGILFAVAALVRPAASQDAGAAVLEPQVNAWSYLAKEYLVARENLWPIVPPSELFDATAGSAVKAETLAAWQETPLWFIPFECGVCYYGDLSPLAAEVSPGTEAAVFEDLAAKEVRIFVERAEGPVEAAAFRAPPIKTTPRDGDAFFEDIQKRRVAWRVTLQPLSAAGALSGLSASQLAAFSLEPGSMMLLMSRPPEADTNIVFFGIQPETNGMRIAIGYPTGFTNGLDLFTTEDLNDPLWNLTATNVTTTGGNEMDWLDEGAGTTWIRFYAAGDATTDSDGDGLPDARESLAYGTNPQLADSDHDGMPDGWEAAQGFNPLADDSALDADGDGLCNLVEYLLGLRPKVAAHSGNLGLFVVTPLQR